VRASFTDVRKRLLPEIISSRYQVAKATYDRKDWPVAEQQFTIVLALLDDPDNGGRLGDLRTLASGFLELSARGRRAATTRRWSNRNRQRQRQRRRPRRQRQPPRRARSPAPVAPAAPTGPVPGKIYIIDDPGVTPPVVIKQDIPNIPQPLMATAKPRGPRRGDRGRARAHRVDDRALFDPSGSTTGQLLAAARDWKIQAGDVTTASR
jgi:hypothetical protein